MWSKTNHHSTFVNHIDEKGKKARERNRKLRSYNRSKMPPTNQKRKTMGMPTIVKGVINKGAKARKKDVTKDEVSMKEKN